MKKNGIKSKTSNTPPVTKDVEAASLPTIEEVVRKDHSVEAQSAKGMRDIIGKDLLRYQGFFEKASEIALYYGFKPIETPILENTSLYTRGLGETTDIVEKEMYTLKTKGGGELAVRPEGTASVMRAYLENGLQSWSQPVLLYYYGPFLRHEKPQKGRYRQFYQFGLESIGSEKSLSDALVIKNVMAILEETGLTHLSLEINSIGDKECRPAYRRALIAYYKKKLPQVCADCKNRFKTNPLRMLDCKDEKCQVIKKEAPHPVSSLCPPCKSHFKEVLEYLETLGIEYVINHTLVRGLDYYSRTVFEVNAAESGSSVAIASGGRYDALARQLGSKKEIPAFGAAIGVDRVLELPEAADLTPRFAKPAKFFLIQLGYEAKLHSLGVTELLRKSKIPVAQSLSKDSLSVQLGTAERLKIPYTIILGQKEVLEKSVIVRNMETRSQETVLLTKLADYVKKLK